MVAGQHHTGSFLPASKIGPMAAGIQRISPFLIALLTLTLHHHTDRVLTLAAEEIPGVGVESSAECSVQPILHCQQGLQGWVVAQSQIRLFNYGSTELLFY